MKYLKELIKSIFPILKYLVLSYFVIFVFFVIYILFGGLDVVDYVVNYATYVLVIFNFIYAFYLLKKYKVFCRRTTCILPFVMLGIAIACFGNMLIFRVNTNEVIKMNMLFLVFSSVIVGPLVEELLFRNVLVNKLLSFNNRVVTILLASFIFAIMHSGILNIVYTFMLGIILNTVFIKEKNLLYPLIIHSSANLVVLFLVGFNSYILFLSFILLVISLFIVKRDYLLK